jgi:hypothetical protein
MRMNSGEFFEGKFGGQGERSSGYITPRGERRRELRERYQSMLVCNDTTCFDITDPSYHVLRIFGLTVIVGQGFLLPVSNEREAETIIAELERGSS